MMNKLIFLPWGYTMYIQKEVLLMQAKVKAWGNSQGIRIPKEVLQEAAVSVDDVLDVKVSNGMIMLVKPFRHRTLEERADEYGGQLHLDGEFDWGEPVGREIWE
jgi:antitoxin MazE